MITIHPSERIEDGARTKISAVIDLPSGPTPLWFSVERAYGTFLTPGRQDNFLLALLALSMQLGQDVRVKGMLSEKLFYNVTRNLMRIMSLLYPHLKPVRILPDRLDRDSLGGEGVVTGLSGGVDSFCVFADHFLGDVPAGFKITHCIFNNVGSHRHGEEGRALFHRRYERLRPLGVEWQVPFLTIDSNLADLLESCPTNPPQKFVFTHTLRNASAALVLQKLFGKFLYASAFPYKNCRIGPSEAMGYADPFAVHLLSTETTQCISTGCEHDRVQKTRRVISIPASMRYLDVCCRKMTWGRKTHGNCSVCKKCMRTMLTLDILGVLEQYSQVFELDRYRKIRNRYLAEVTSSHDPFFGEILELARERGFVFPPLVRWAGRLGLRGVFPGRRSLRDL